MASGRFEIAHVNAEFEREPLSRPFGFKGGYLSELWQAVSYLEDRGGRGVVGLGTQSVLWSDAAVFASQSQAGGNAFMFGVTEWALQTVRGATFEDPLEMLDEVLPRALTYARRITRRPELRTTFVLNALVGVDLAAWVLHARSGGVEHFDEMIPKAYRAALMHRHDAVALVPAVGYGMSLEDVGRTADEGFLCLKIKLGHPGSQEEMLEADKQRLSSIHRLVVRRQTPHTKNGRLAYYLDANGRYDRKETLLRLLDHADTIGALERIVLVEEPFPESSRERVDDLAVRIAADESAHTDVDARERIDLGYGAIALKPVAKTLSMTLKILRVAHERGVPCFCADLTVNPILVEWNKAVAARLAPLPGFQCGFLEANGRQHYRNWVAMSSYHPLAGAPWTKAVDGMFRLGDDFYEQDAGVFETPRHYMNMVRPARADHE